jgi:MFS family permease
MYATVKALSALLLGVFLLMLGNGLLGTFLSVRMTLDGFSSVATAIMMAAYYAGLIAGTLLAGRIIRRVGHIRAFTAFAGIATAAVLAHGFWVSPVPWTPLRAVTGFAMAGLYMVIESWFNERATRANRGRVFAVYQVTSYVALAAGQFLLNLADPQGLKLLSVAAVLLVLCLVPVAVTRAVHPDPIEQAWYGLRRMMSVSPLGTAGCFAAGLVTGSFYALGPVYGLGSGLGISGVALFMAVAVIGGLMVQWPLGMLSDRVDRRHLLGAVALFLVGISVLMVYLTDGVGTGLRLLFAAVYGGLLFTLYPLVVAHVNDRVDSRLFVPVSATLLFIWGVGSVAGPLGAAPLMDVFGPTGLFLFTGAIAVALGVFAYAWPREAVPVADHGPYANVPRTTPVIAELAPQVENPETPAKHG